METKQNIRPLMSVSRIEPGELFLHGGDLPVKHEPLVWELA